MSFYLNIELVVNKQVKKFKVDLRKGKVILFDYCAGEEGRSETKKITVEQLQEEVIFM